MNLSIPISITTLTSFIVKAVSATLVANIILTLLVSLNTSNYSSVVIDPCKPKYSIQS